MERTRRELLPGVFLTYIGTDKFKTSILSLHLLTGLDRQTAAQNALLPGVLRRGTVASPDLTALAARLDGMYGAHIEPSVRKLGEIQAVGFAADFCWRPIPGAGCCCPSMWRASGKSCCIRSGPWSTTGRPMPKAAFSG